MGFVISCIAALPTAYMKAQEVATMCVLVLLFRLVGVSCPPGFCCLQPLWSVNVLSLDQCKDGLTRDCGDPLVMVHVMWKLQ